MANSATVEPALCWIKSSAKDAQGVWCHTCETLIGDKCHPYFTLGNIKGMHLTGSGAGHRVDYVKLEDANLCH